MKKWQRIALFLAMALLIGGISIESIFFAPKGEAVGLIEASATEQVGSRRESGDDPKETIAGQGTIEERLDVLMDQYKGTVWNGNYYGIECKGFANLIFYKMFDVRIIGLYDDSFARLDYLKGAEELGYLDGKKATKKAMIKLLKKGQPADYIQVRKEKGGNKWPHTMILVKVKKNGIRVFDCNSDGKNSVKVHFITWKQFCKDNEAMSLYHAKRYE